MEIVNVINSKNETNKILQDAIEQNYESVFIVGLKNKKLITSNSGFNNLESRIGALEMIKYDLLKPQ